MSASGITGDNLVMAGAEVESWVPPASVLETRVWVEDRAAIRDVRWHFVHAGASAIELPDEDPSPLQSLAPPPSLSKSSK